MVDYFGDILYDLFFNSGIFMNYDIPNDFLKKENKEHKIYGIYPDNIQNVNEVNNFDEVSLYLTIDSLNTYIKKCEIDIENGDMPFIDLSEEKYALEYLIYQTTKFGVILPTPSYDKHIIITDSFNNWFNFYNNHFKNVLTKDEWNSFLMKRENGQDTSMYMPFW